MAWVPNIYTTFGTSSMTVNWVAPPTAPASYTITAQPGNLSTTATGSATSATLTLPTPTQSAYQVTVARSYDSGSLTTTYYNEQFRVNGTTTTGGAINFSQSGSSNIIFHFNPRSTVVVLDANINGNWQGAVFLSFEQMGFTANSPFTCYIYVQSTNVFEIRKADRTLVYTYTSPLTSETTNTATMYSLTLTDEATPANISTPYNPLPVPLNNDVVPWAWFDAADTTTLITSGTAVTGWQNKGTSASASPSASGTVSGTVTAFSNTMNNRNVVTLGASSSFTTASLTPTSQSSAVFVVNRPLVTVPAFTYPTVFYGLLPWVFMSSDGTTYSINYRTYAENKMTISGLPNFNGQAGLYTLINSTSTAKNVIAVNGTNQTLIVNVAAGGQTLSAGTYSMNLQADHAEILVYMGEITNTTRYQIEGYLAWKWGLQASLPASHPYSPTYRAITMALYNRPRLFSSTYAGSTGATGACVDGPLATARFRNPAQICADAQGNIYVADALNHNIRKITASTGLVTTIVGSTAGLSGTTDAFGNNARFNVPIGIGINAANTLLYVSEQGNNRIRQVNLSTLAVTTLAGPDGASAPTGDTDGTGNIARFNTPYGLAIHPTTGDIYVADALNNKIRRITPAGVVTTPYGPAQGTTTAGNTDATGNNARFNQPGTIAFDKNGDIYVADQNARKLRKITFSTGAVTSFTGIANTSSSAGHVNGHVSEVQLQDPLCMCFDDDNNMYLADGNGNNIRRISPSGCAVTIAGARPSTTTGGTTDGLDMNNARFNRPFGILLLENTLIISDHTNNSIRRLSRGAPNQVGTLVTSSVITNPANIIIDGYGNLYCGNWTASATLNRTVNRIDMYGNAAVFAGNASSTGDTDGAGTSALLGRLGGSALDIHNNLYVADSSYTKIKKITPAGLVVTIITTPGGGGYPRDLAFDNNNLLYFIDEGAATIYRVNANNSYTNVASGGTVLRPLGLSFDSNNNMYVCCASGSGGQRILRIAPTTYAVTTVAGSGATGNNDANGISATFNDSVDLAVDRSTGMIYVAQYASNIRRIATNGDVLSVAGLYQTTGTTDGIGTAARFTNPYGIWIDGQRNVWISDTTANSIRVMNIGLTPATPTPVTARPFTTSNFITYYWNAPDTTASTITVACGPTTVTLPPTARQYTFTNLTTGRAYEGSMFVVNAEGIASTRTFYRTATPGGVPSIPTVASIVAQGRQVLASWSQPDSDGASPIGWYALISSDNVYRYGIEPFRRSFLSPVLPVGTYTFRLIAINSVGYGDPYTATVTIT